MRASAIDIGVGTAVLLSPAGANAALRALVSLNLSDAWTLTLMPRVGYRLMPSWAHSFAHEDEGSAPFAGGGVGGERFGIVIGGLRSEATGTSAGRGTTGG